MDALAELINITKQSISKYENGLMLPSYEILNKMAKALGKEYEDFMRPVMDGVAKMEVSFRKQPEMKATERKALEENIKDQVQNFLTIKNVLGRETSIRKETERFDILSTDDMVLYAKWLRGVWGLGDMPITNVQRLLTEKGIVLIWAKGKGNWDGASGKVNGNQYVIVLNECKGYNERMRFSAMHELCHLLCNDCFNSKLTEGNKEKLCNVFASEMLLPSDVVTKTLGRKGKIYENDLFSIRERYGISTDAIVYKLLEMKLITIGRQNRYYREKNKSEESRKGIEKIRFVEEKCDCYADMVCEAYERRLITRERAEDYLGAQAQKYLQTKLFF